MAVRPVVLADRYAGVRVALGERLEAAGAVRVLGEAGTLAEARTLRATLPPGGLLLSGLRFPDGPVSALLDGSCPVVVYTWLPPDERGVDLGAAAAVVGTPLVPGLLAVLSAPSVPYYPVLPQPRRGKTVRAFHLSLPVADLAAAADFYAEVLGCARHRTGADWADLDFHGHQLSLHEVAGYRPEPHRSVVDGTEVPARHLGVVLDPEAWQALADRLTTAGVTFLLSPRSRFVGEPGEQHTFFLTDPSGNAIEVKAFPDGVWR